MKIEGRSERYNVDCGRKWANSQGMHTACKSYGRGPPEGDSVLPVPYFSPVSIVLNFRFAVK